ncbi:hypothetical protein ACJX0J_032270, partial [Zea mays]
MWYTRIIPLGPSERGRGGTTGTHVEGCINTTRTLNYKLIFIHDEGNDNHVFFGKEGGSKEEACLIELNIGYGATTFGHVNSTSYNGGKKRDGMVKRLT